MCSILQPFYCSGKSFYPHTNAELGGGYGTLIIQTSSDISATGDMESTGKGASVVGWVTPMAVTAIDRDLRFLG